MKLIPTSATVKKLLYFVLAACLYLIIIELLIIHKVENGLYFMSSSMIFNSPTGFGLIFFTVKYLGPVLIGIIISLLIKPKSLVKNVLTSLFATILATNLFGLILPTFIKATTDHFVTGQELASKSVLKEVDLKTQFTDENNNGKIDNLKISGTFDSSDMLEGIYDFNITLYKAGDNKPINFPGFYTEDFKTTKSKTNFPETDIPIESVAKYDKIKIEIITWSITRDSYPSAKLVAILNVSCLETLIAPSLCGPSYVKYSDPDDVRPDQEKSLAQKYIIDNIQLPKPELLETQNENPAQTPQNNSFNLHEIGPRF